MKPDLPNGKYYTFLDLPQLPFELEQMCLNRVNEKEHFIFELGNKSNDIEFDMDYYGQRVKKRQCIFQTYSVPLQIKEWLHNNRIIKNIDSEVVVQKSYGGNVLLPHIDKTENYSSSSDGNIRERHYALNYLLSETGPKTCFYKNENIDSIIEGIIIPKRYWHVLHVRKLHGVEDIEFDRITLSITLEK